jgi:hypothetical protein
MELVAFLESGQTLALIVAIVWGVIRMKFTTDALIVELKHVKDAVNKQEAAIKTQQEVTAQQNLATHIIRSDVSFLRDKITGIEVQLNDKTRVNGA